MFNARLSQASYCNYDKLPTFITEVLRLVSNVQLLKCTTNTLLPFTLAEINVFCNKGHTHQEYR